MKYCLVYWSRFGHGKKIVNYIDDKLKNNNHEVQICKTDEVNPRSMPDADVYIFSAPTEAFRIQRNMRGLLKKLDGMEGKKYGIINTHAMKRRHWLKSMEKMLSKKKMIKTAEVDFQIGEGQNKGEGLMDGWDTKLDDFINNI